MLAVYVVHPRASLHFSDPMPGVRISGALDTFVLHTLARKRFKSRIRFLTALTPGPLEANEGSVRGFEIVFCFCCCCFILVEPDLPCRK